MTQFTTQGTSALAINQEAPALSIVPKAPEISIGSVISYAWGKERFELPIIAIKRDFFGRPVQYAVPSISPEHGLFTMISATDSLHIQSISAPKPLSKKASWLVMLWSLGAEAAKMRAEATKHKAFVFSSVVVAPIQTRRGFGFHDELIQSIEGGNEAEYERCKTEAQRLDGLYMQLLDVMSGKV